MTAGVAQRSSPLQLTARSAIVQETTDQRALAALADAFASAGCVLLPGFLEAGLLARLRAGVAAARFYERPHGRVAMEACMEPNDSLGALHFLVNDPIVLRAIGRIAGLERLTCFVGRVYRFESGRPHFDSWHSDAAPGREVGLSVNLSESAYEGGRFEIRRTGSDAPLASVANTGPGDALVFSIRDGLEHRVTPVLGRAPRTAFAGWFGADRPYELRR